MPASGHKGMHLNFRKFSGCIHQFLIQAGICFTYCSTIVKHNINEVSAAYKYWRQDDRLPNLYQTRVIFLKVLSIEFVIIRSFSFKDQTTLIFEIYKLDSWNYQNH